MEPIKNHRDLIIWQLSMDLAVDLYQFTKQLPDDEKFGLISQIKRSATSVPLNIAEGAGRRTTGAYIQFLNIALGSLSEIDTQLEMCLRLKFTSDIQSFITKMVTIRVKILNLIKVLESKKE